MMSLLALFIGSIFVNNILLSRFLGCCPFLGVSSKIETAKGMGIAVVLVIVFASLMTWLAYTFVLVPLGLEYLYTLAFILIIAALVQFVEIVMKEGTAWALQIPWYIPSSYHHKLRCLGVAVINMNENYSLVQSLVHAFGASTGFLVAIVLMAGIRERIEISQKCQNACAVCL